MTPRFLPPGVHVLHNPSSGGVGGTSEYDGVVIPLMCYVAEGRLPGVGLA